MLRFCPLAITLCASCLVTSTTFADEAGELPTRIRSSVERAVPLLEAGSAGSADQRECFTCHSQAVPVFALTAAARSGFRVDPKNLERQIEHTVTHLQRGYEGYTAGKGQGGQVLTAGYALWTLDVARHPPDETTTAVAQYLQEYQKDQSHWSHHGDRPPTSGSDFTATFVSLRGLLKYSPSSQAEPTAVRRRTITDWVRSRKPLETEDHVFRLLLIELLKRDAAQVSAGENFAAGSAESPVADLDALAAMAAAELLQLQRADGGWGQKPDMDSDAYATSTALMALQEDGTRTVQDLALRRGIEFLLSTQQDDGSWHVRTRAKPIQTYFESGFPHGEDQFLSISATGWSVVALVHTLGESRGD